MGREKGEEEGGEERGGQGNWVGGVEVEESKEGWERIVFWSEAALLRWESGGEEEEGEEKGPGPSCRSRQPC